MSDERAARDAVIAAVRRLDARGLNRGSTGNASLRWRRAGRDGMLITPTGMGADDMQAEDLCWVDDDGTAHGPWQPSSEWHFHRAVYRVRADAGAVLHTHAVHATALGCLGQGLPSFHYMVAVAGGDDVPLVPYHLFGTEALSQAVGLALRDRWACLLAQHGLVSAGVDIDQAMKVMCEVEHLCHTYLVARATGTPALLDRSQMAHVIERFKSYGSSRRRDG